MASARIKFSINIQHKILEVMVDLKFSVGGFRLPLGTAAILVVLQSLDISP